MELDAGPVVLGLADTIKVIVTVMATGFGGFWLGYWIRGQR